MIAWQNPALLWALPIAAAPVLVHLLRRHVADRAMFPSVRFVRASQSAAVRLRHPSDLLLLVLRTVALLVAVLAVAGPVLLTNSRLERWNSDVARAIVVDVSPSMRANGPDGVSPERVAADAGQAEAQTATYANRIETTDVRAGVRRSAAWLKSVPPSRREIVVISDFQRGSIDARLVEGVEQAVGVRFVQAGRPASVRRIAGAALLGAGGVPPRSQTIELAGDATSVTVSRSDDAQGSEGLRILPPGPPAETLMNVVAAAGTPSGAAEEPIVIRFDASDPGAPALASVRAGWMLRTLLRIQREIDGHLAGTLPAVRPVGESSPWSAIVRDHLGKPLVAAAAAGNALVLDVAAPPESFFAAAVVRAALAGRRAPADYDEDDISRVPASTLSALSREARRFELPSAGPDVWRQLESTDGRWCWAAVLMLLGVEQWLRARTHGSRQQEAPRVAA